MIVQLNASGTASNQDSFNSSLKNDNPFAKKSNGDILDAIKEEEAFPTKESRDASISVTRRRMKSSDMSKSFTETT